MVYSLQPGILYGPIHSRRFGRSLGINLSPVERKLCSFNCIYCHYGSTHRLTTDETGWAEDLPTADLVLEVVEAALQTTQDIDVVTFSGNGEPTLHPEFSTIARGVAELVENYRPTLRTVLLSNSSGLARPEVREALRFIDMPVMKLDAGTPQTFINLNRPAGNIHFEAIVDELAQLEDFSLQTLLLDGQPNNTSSDELEAYFQLVGWIVPNEVQLYSTDRPVAKTGIGKVSPARLRRIAREGQDRTGVAFRVFSA